MARKNNARDVTKMILWGRAGGRCQFRNCGRRVDLDRIAGNMAKNDSYVAHIVAAEPGGVRGDAVRSAQLADDISNLMLMCDTHHREIDDRKLSHMYTEAALLEMKAENEARIDGLLSPRTTKSAHILQVSSPIGPNETAVIFDDAVRAVVATHTLAEPRPIEIKIRGMRHKDSDPNYYLIEIGRIVSQYAQDVRWRFEKGDIEHLAVFALAPIPVLIELGRQISDISSASVYQLHREPQQQWAWPDDGVGIDFRLSQGPRRPKRVALKLEVSSEIEDSRIKAVVGEDVSIWSIRSSDTGTSVLRNQVDLGKFRQLAGKTLDRIKGQHGPDVEVLVFPAVPNSIGVEFGRVWQPKAHPSLAIYDQSGAQGFLLRHRLQREQTPVGA